MTGSARIRKAAELADSAEGHYGPDKITHATGEGLAAVVNVLLALAGPLASPTV
ncbi:hypothetical protein HEP87_51235 [Streptomyces sp. S1D4-11]|nr:hypothetical protein [Streptomyces sp. S1D4-11]QIZ00613.1 hypothetical protein HEP87_51235 [Streptomyces sp. S1D4-11]